MTDIIDLEEKKRKLEEKKRKKKEEKEGNSPKLHRQVICRALADLLNNTQASLPPFPHSLFANLVGKEDAVRKIIVVSKDNICREASKEFVVDALSVYLRSTPEIIENPNFFFEDHQVQSCVTSWLRGAKTMPEPLSVTFQDDPRETYLRLPWAFDSTGETPLFDELFSRMTNALAARHFIGSLFDDASYRQQYLYIYGDGQDGKGALVNFLLKVFKFSGSILSCPLDKKGELLDKHWTANVENLRLGVFDDLDVFNFPSSGFFKSLTGLDLVSVNPKNKKAYQVYLKMKFIITANRLPVLGSSTADQRRVIICELDAPETLSGVETYEERLFAEGGPFLSRCIEDYRKAYPTHAPIECDISTAEALGEERDMVFSDTLEAHFVLRADQKITRDALFKILLDMGWSTFKIGDFKAWLKIKHKVKEFRPRVTEGPRAKFYSGIGAKPLPTYCPFTNKRLS